MNAAELNEIVKDVPREAWPQELRNHSTFDPAEPERFWIIYGPMGDDDKRCIHITADIAAEMFIGSMTAWLARNKKYSTFATYEDGTALVALPDRCQSIQASSLVAALAAACKEAAR